jgi:hypothetical protein
VTDQAAFLDLDAIPAIDLLDDLKAMITAQSKAAPRSLQRSLGPSEVGHPCSRKLALSLTGEERSNPEGDPLPSIVGTAAHAWLEQMARDENERLGRVRWLPEQRVTVRTGLSGTCDLYDVDTATVIDWKLPGTSRMSHYRKHGPSRQYEVQAHLYGRGYQNMGFPVERVAIAFLPRGGLLRGKHGAHVWTAAYDDDLVTETIDRLDAITLAIHDLQVDVKPEHYALIPSTPTDCEYCPFWAPNPSSPTQCGGN